MTKFRATLGVLADVIGVALFGYAVVGALSDSTSQRLTGYLLAGVAVAATVSVVAPWQPGWRWVHEVVRFTLIGVTMATSAALLLTVPARPQVTIDSPQLGDVQDRCLVEVRFTGTAPRDHRFVLATRQGGGSYYFEGAVQQRADASHWAGTVQLGFADRGLNEQYDILVFSMPGRWADYLRTTRAADGEGNTWWVSPGPPPEVGEPVAAIWVPRSANKDSTCRAD
jgi:hypothetical protein